MRKQYEINLKIDNLKKLKLKIIYKNVKE